MAINISKKFDSPWNHFCSNLDLEIINVGIARDFFNWRRFGLTAEPFFRLYLPVKGAFTMEYSFGSFEVSPGSLYLFPPWIPCRFVSIKPCSHYWIHFVSEQLRLLPSASRPQEIKLDNTACLRFRNDFRKLLKLSMEDLDISRCIEVRMQMEAMIKPFMALIQQDASSEAVHAMELKPVLDYIENNFTRQIRIEELSDLAGLSRVEFSKRFHAAFGLPPKQYISARRISHAKNLLLETNLTVKEIAFQCGYDNEYFFSRIFKEYAMSSPRKFRNLYNT